MYDKDLNRLLKIAKAAALSRTPSEAFGRLNRRRRAVRLEHILGLARADDSNLCPGSFPLAAFRLLPATACRGVPAPMSWRISIDCDQ